jgi:predicted dehydrogenase
VSGLAAPGPPVRWAILGTANIARAQFLPGLREAGGVAAAVAARDASRAERYGRDNGIERAIGGYQNLIDDPAVDALYIPLPNSLHAEWTLRALAAGRPVLCEKPLCGNLADTVRVLDAARLGGSLLWEAFVFPFHRQIAQLRDLVTGGAIGELMEIKSNFHFQLSNPGNIRYSRELEGGALNDVGCYPVRLAAEFFGVPHEAAWAGATWGGDSVDVDSWGVLEYPGGRRLHLSCGLGRGYDTFSSLEGTAGRIHVSNPFHPGPADTYQVIAPRSEPASFPATAGEASFTAAIRHINAALAGDEEPRLLAVDTALSTASGLHDLAQSFTARANRS